MEPTFPIIDPVTKIPSYNDTYSSCDDNSLHIKSHNTNNCPSQNMQPTILTLSPEAHHHKTLSPEAYHHKTLSGLPKGVAKPVI